MSQSKIKGSCLCGEITYEIRPPYLFFHYCHCSRCRKSSGTSHAANILVKADQFAWLTGESLTRRYELPSAKHFCTGFCSKCGSTMPWLTKSGKAFLVPAGTLDDDPGTTPENSIYWDSRASWYREVSDLPKFAEGALKT